MERTNTLLQSAQALAALTARLRLDSLGEDGDPAVRKQLERVVDALGVREDVDGLDDRERTVLVSFARSYLAQAVELVEEPARRGAWSFDDPVLLQAQGSASAVVAHLLADAGLVRDGARVLDVGTGVAGLAIALCERFADVAVVGLDPWEPALALARANVAAAGLEGRIELVGSTVEEFADPEGFDLAWLPAFFIPEDVLDRAIEQIFGVVRRGGTLVTGVPYGTDDDPLGSAVDDLFTVRAGGSAAGPDDLAARLRRAGFEVDGEVERTWQAPLRLVAGLRP